VKPEGARFGPASTVHSDLERLRLEKGLIFSALFGGSSRGANLALANRLFTWAPPLSSPSPRLRLGCQFLCSSFARSPPAPSCRKIVEMNFRFDEPFEVEDTIAPSAFPCSSALDHPTPSYVSQ
jgi:hypothetical protein